MKKSLFSFLFLVMFTCAQIFAQEAKSKPVSVESERTPTVEMSVVGNKIYVENATVGKKIEIFSVVGLKISEIEIKTSSGEYILNVTKGYYILKLSDTVRKVVIR